MNPNTHLTSPAAAAGNPTPQSTPAGGVQQKGEFNILPIDEDKKYAPPPKGRHSQGQPGGPDPSSEFHVGPALMPGAFMSSMGTNATAFEREFNQKSEKE
ncbi:hypothetical protein BGZ98_004506 [Dissophora globulifera]|nr:hypothetical protein BGZ98_004506 [Dissophora globulifera]